MQVKVTTQGDWVVVHLIGHLDVETAEPFRQACLSQLTDKKVIFDFRSLSFVGSSGILFFLETMRDFMRTNRQGMRFCGVGSEFRKVLAATSLNAVDVFENENLAASPFEHAGPGAAASAVVAAPTASGDAPSLPPLQPRVVMEGINPIFLDAEPEAAAELEPEPSESQRVEKPVGDVVE